MFKGEPQALPLSSLSPNSLPVFWVYGDLGAGKSRERGGSLSRWFAPLAGGGRREGAWAGPRDGAL